MSSNLITQEKPGQQAQGLPLLCDKPIDVTTKEANPGHALVKHQFSMEKLEVAVNQSPFQGVKRPVTDQEHADYYNQDNWKTFMENFFAEQFIVLSQFGVNFDLPNYDDLEVREQAEQARLQQSYQGFRESGLSGQASALKSMYDEFAGMRKGFSFLHSNKVLQPLCVMPINYLPDLFVAAPVWYTHSKEQSSAASSVHHKSIQQLCRLQGTQAFANMYLTLNHKYRTFEQYDGDIVLEKTAQLIPLLKDHYDLLAIATPYLDVVAKEYDALPRNRLIDPYLIGFNWSTPSVFYFFARWSNTGLFPLVEHMIANTMDFLQSRTVQYDKLGGNSGYVSWLRAKDDFGRFDYDSLYMGKFKAQLIKAYNSHELFGLLKSGKF